MYQSGPFFCGLPPLARVVAPTILASAFVVRVGVIELDVYLLQYHRLDKFSWYLDKINRIHVIKQHSLSELVPPQTCQDPNTLYCIRTPQQRHLTKCHFLHNITCVRVLLLNLWSYISSPGLVIFSTRF